LPEAVRPSMATRKRHFDKFAIWLAISRIIHARDSEPIAALGCFHVETDSNEVTKLIYRDNTGIETRVSRAGGDRTHDRGIMRWMRSVGMVRWCRFGPDLKENLSGGVGSVRLGRIGMWDESCDLYRTPSRRIRSSNVHCSPSNGNRTIDWLFTILRSKLVFIVIKSQEHFAAFACGQASMRHCEFAK
jgi:hypothetical protein